VEVPVEEGVIAVGGQREFVDAGVVDQNVHRAGLFGELPDVVGVAEVGAQESGKPPGAFDCQADKARSVADFCEALGAGAGHRSCVVGLGDETVTGWAMKVVWEPAASWSLPTKMRSPMALVLRCRAAVVAYRFDREGKTTSGKQTQFVSAAYSEGTWWLFEESENEQGRSHLSPPCCTTRYLSPARSRNRDVGRCPTVAAGCGRRSRRLPILGRRDAVLVDAPLTTAQAGEVGD
jgi:hypothetical protein